MSTPRFAPRWRVACLAGIVAVTSLLAACGSTGPSQPGTTPPPASTPAASSPTPAAPAPAPASPTPAAPAPASPTARPSGGAALTGCRTTSLRITLDASQASGTAGSAYYPLNFTNTSKSACYLYGYPGVSFVTGPSGSPIGKPASRNPAVAPATVILAPGGTAHVTIQVVDALNYSKSDCQPVTAHWLKVFPPGQFTALYVKFSSLTCSAKLPSKLGSALSVDAVKGGGGQPGQGL